MKEARELLVEAALLLALGQGEEISAFRPPRGSEAPEIVRLARLHKIHPFLLHHLSRGSLTTRAEWAESQLELASLRREHERCLQATRSAAALLEQGGIDAVIVKGITSSTGIFSGMPYRVSADVDVVVRPSSAREADRLLSARGLCREELVNRWQAGLVAEVFGRRAYGSDPFVVDLHWRPRYPVGTALVELDADSLVSGRVPGEGELAGLPVAREDGSLVFALAHLLSDSAEGRASLRSAIETIFLAIRAGGLAEAAISSWPPVARAAAVRILELSRSRDVGELRRYLAEILVMNPAAPPSPDRSVVISRLSPFGRAIYLAGYLVPNPSSGAYRGALAHYARLARKAGSLVRPSR